MFRSLATLAFTAGAVVLIAALTLLGRAPGSPLRVRHLREMKDRLEEPREVARFSLDDMGELPHRLSVGEYSAYESRGVVLEGWVQGMLLAGDGDTHLELVTRDPGPHGRDSTYATGEITPLWRLGAPAWSYDSLLAAFRPFRGGRTAWDDGPRRVRLTGWLCYDYQYDFAPTSWALQFGAPRRTGWEMHPVTKVELWNPVDSSYVELRR